MSSEIVPAGIAALEPGSPEFDAAMDRIRAWGEEAAAKAASIGSAFLEQSLGRDDESEHRVAEALSELRGVIDDVDPSRGALRRLLSRGANGFERRYASNKARILAIDVALESSRQQLMLDNEQIMRDRGAIWEQLSAGKQSLAELEAMAEEFERLGAEEALFEVNVRRRDLQVQLAVAAQAHLSMELIAKNNRELIRSVESTRRTTMNALRSAVMVAQALANQSRVVKQIDAVAERTDALIASSGKTLRSNAADIHRQAIDGGVSADTIAKALDDIRAAARETEDLRRQAGEKLSAQLAGLGFAERALQAGLAREQEAARILEIGDGK